MPTSPPPTSRAHKVSSGVAASIYYFVILFSRGIFWTPIMWSYGLFLYILYKILGAPCTFYHATMQGREKAFTLGGKGHWTVNYNISFIINILLFISFEIFGTFIIFGINWCKSPMMIHKIIPYVYLQLVVETFGYLT